jgi:hypothetical protein
VQLHVVCGCGNAVVLYSNGKWITCEKALQWQADVIEVMIKRIDTRFWIRVDKRLSSTWRTQGFTPSLQVCISSSHFINITMYSIVAYADRIALFHLRIGAAGG